MTHAPGHNRKQAKITVCTECKHYLNLGPGSAREGCWYNCLCKAAPLPTKVDPLDGKEKPYISNDLGREVFTKNQFEYCRELNNGNCPMFSAKITCRKVSGQFTDFQDPHGNNGGDSPLTN